MNTLRILYHLAKADFLERVRRYSFLITLGLTAYFCYICLPPNHGPYSTLQIGGHRGIYNSPYVGTLVALETALLLSLAGFYLVKNSIDRDLTTGVGQILAATPVTTRLYTFGKALSNLAVLTVMVAVISIAAGVMQLARHEDLTIEFWPLVEPFLVIVLPAMAVVASAAVLFEVIPLFRAGFGNVAYFFLWVTVLGTTETAVDFSGWGSSASPFPFGVVEASIRSACTAAFPDCAATKDFSFGFNFRDTPWDLTTFRWAGVHWHVPIILGRLVWIGLAVAIALFAAALFHRFDPARESRKKAKAPRKRSLKSEDSAPRPAIFNAALRSLTSRDRRFRFTKLVAAELRIAFKSVNRWWYVVALGLAAGELVSPLAVSRFFLIAAWIWPILIWSAMGTRENRQDTAQLVFSTAHPLRRQLPACWLAGVIITAMIGFGTGVRFMLARDVAHVAVWCVGVLFIPTLALALGVWSGSGKLFEVVYTLLWYAGPANQVAPLDFTGTAHGASSSTAPFAFLACSAVLAFFAVVGRRRQIRT